ncbi:hypothetical protein FACS1894167_09160 [Synergistales bacterium]|nr:hypothetical protein FACS1894167_09160 [Synergistales bacterium]
MPFLPAAGDIVFAPFPFEEDRSRVKKRPCLVLTVDLSASQFLGAKITTTELKQWWAYPLNPGNVDVSSGSIKEKSWINLNRREWILCKDCLCVFATLRPEILEIIRSRFLL